MIGYRLQCSDRQNEMDRADEDLPMSRERSSKNELRKGKECTKTKEARGTVKNKNKAANNGRKVPPTPHGIQQKRPC